jgi:hypothetical protein
MQKKFLAVCFLVGVLGAVSVQAGDNNKKKQNGFSWKVTGYSVLKYVALPITGVNAGVQLTRLFTPKITAGIAAKFGALAKLKFVGSLGTTVVTKAAPYLLYGYGVPAVIVAGAVTLGYKKYVLKKKNTEILSDIFSAFSVSRDDN